MRPTHARATAPSGARAARLAPYTTEGFEAAVATRYEVRSRTPIPGSPRVLYHLVRR